MRKSIHWLGLTLFAALLTLAPGAFASTNYALKVTAERPDALYSKGEPVRFNIALTLDNSPVADAEVHWTLTKDGVPPTTSGTVKLSAGKGVITGKLDEPGFLLCRATYTSPSSNSYSALGGAGISPLEIKPSMPVPDDFDAFWDGKKKELAKIPIHPRLTRVRHTNTAIECFNLQADCLGAPVSGFFARPVGAKPKSLPIILTVHGAGVRSSDLTAAARWAGENMLALDINAHGLPNAKPASYYNKLAAGELKDYRVRGRESRETVYFLGMFMRLVRAIDFLTAQPEWDGKIVVVHGSSQGGAQSIVAAGLDPRVTFFAAAVPAMCDHTGFSVGRINGWPKFIGTGEKPDPKIVEAVRYYDAMNFATRTKAAGIFSVGFIDPTCPPTSVYAAYNALPGKKEIFNDPPSVHTFQGKAVEVLRAAIRKHVKEMQTAK